MLLLLMLLTRSAVAVDTTDEPSCADLVQAAQRSNPSAVEGLLAKNIHPTCTYSWTSTSKKLSAMIPIVKFFVRQKYRHTKHSSTPMHAAVRVSPPNSRVLTLLMDGGADLHAYDSNGNAPLHIAVKQNQPTVPIMLSLGADPKVKTKDGNTALNIATRVSNSSTIQQLIDAGALAQQHGDGPKSNVIIALKRRRFDLVKLLVNEGASCGETGSLTVPALIEKIGNTQALTWCSEHGLDLHEADISHLRTPRFIRAAIGLGGDPTTVDLTVPVRKADLATTRTLLGLGADANYLATNHDTPLAVAVLGRSTAMVDLLVTHGATLEDQHLKMAACGRIRSNVPMVIHLIDHGADPHALTPCLTNPHFRRDLTKLRYLISMGADGTQLPIDHDMDPVTLRTLLELGADVTLLDPTALQVDQLAVVKDFGVDLGRYDLLRAPIEEQDLRTLRALIDIDVDPETHHSLHLALSTHNLEALEYLLSHGANPNATDREGVPLGHSASTAPDVLFQLVLAHGATVSGTVDGRGVLARSHAKRPDRTLFLISKGGRAEGVNLVALIDQSQLDMLPQLLRAGANVNQATLQDGVAVHAPVAALRNGHAELADVLFDHGFKIQSVPLAGLLGSEWLRLPTAAAVTLIQRGADVNRPDSLGTFAIHHAAGRGDLELILALLAAGADPRATNQSGKTPVQIARKAHSARAVKKILRRAKNR
ncbi:MAG: ankyrin repeat protein [Kiritimatiellia bacterium]|jgi:ankyrin repeat protein